MSEYKIEKNVPMPEIHSGKGIFRKYPFRDMKVGDSFFVPKTALSDGSNSVRYAASYFKIRHPGYDFTVRKVENPDGWRIWRTPVEEKERNERNKK